MRRGLLALAVTVLVPIPAGATIVRQASLDELVAGSTVVLHGTVRSVDEQTRPFQTIVELEVVEPIKGLVASDRTFRFTLPGGRSGDLAMYVPGAPRLRQGEEVVLLLARTRAGGFAPTGLGQGVFRVERTGPVPRVSRDLRGAAYVDARGLESPPPPAPATLPDLLTELRTLVRGEQP